MEKYIINYLYEHTDNDLAKKYIDYFKYDMDSILYGKTPSLIRKTYKPSLKMQIQQNLYEAIKYITHPKKTGLINVLDFLGGTWNYDFESIGLNLLSTCWQPSRRGYISNEIFRKSKNRYIKLLYKESYEKFITVDTVNYFEVQKEKISTILQKEHIKGGFFYNQEIFSCKYFIDILKGINRPSFEFIHGLPGIYTPEITNRTDYICVYGDKIKQNYIKAGVDESKILVTGTSKYSDYNSKQSHDLKNCLDDVLVFTTGACNWVKHVWRSEQIVVDDVGFILLYLYQVENVLKSLGVRKARLRPHPMNNKKWLECYIDNNFYIMDNESLGNSLSHATLSIGPTSTSLIDSLTCGVNYVVFEPSENGVKINGGKGVPPFDGTDNSIVIANNESDLLYVLKNNECSRLAFIEEYVSPLNFSEVIKRLNS